MPPGHRMTKVGTDIDSLGSWVTQVMPYLEEGNLFSQIDQDELFFAQTVDIGRGEYEKTHHIFLDSLMCPSDPSGGSSVGLINDHYGARGNFVANSGWSDPGPGFEDCGIWMNDPDWKQIGANGAGHASCRNGISYSSRGGGRPVKSALAGYGPFLVNEGVAIRKIKDGTSKTVAFSEVLKVPGEDMRGCLHWGGGAMYLHTEPPNSKYPDLSRYCVSTPPTPPLPVMTQCRGGREHISWRPAAPSTGGVNVVMIDGSVHFISDDIDSTEHGTDRVGVWQALSTYRGGDYVDASQY